MNLNPMFNEIKRQKKSKPTPKTKPTPTQTPSNKLTTPKKELPLSQKRPVKSNRKTRWDKTKDIKIPLTEQQRMDLRKHFKRYQMLNRTTSQTVFNTQLFRFALRNIDSGIVKWDLPYKDTKRYAHIKPNMVESNLVGGINGYAIEKGLSERQTVHRMVISVLEFLNKGGELEDEEVQPITPTTTTHVSQ
ncbi:hypothetical protein J2S74_002888 [Evansella vedderi]|uniref:ProQ/FinO domain-containing protein n=1 Tax=Evansella vedderi TaxID=38282 RepID=A0ABT9ZXP9_9BACI|nr:hypothetical protein [Evansella vedderi]MDQ0255506.1 hypothetical protein [Evansella vedderi]